MDLGFWALAQAEPHRVALVATDGEEVSAGLLLASSNRLSHGLRALGLEAGDVVAAVLPNGRDLIELYLACMQTGLYLVPINHHLVAAEVSYIVRDSEARVLIGHERFAAVVQAAAQDLDLDPAHLVIVGQLPGFVPFPTLGDSQPDGLPDGRTAGGIMNYTSGTTGKPKGVRRPLTGKSPEESLLTFGIGQHLLFRLQPRDGNVHLVGSPLYHTAVLVYGGGALHLGHLTVLMDKWTAEGMLELIERHRVTSSHMVPTQFHRLLSLPGEVRSRYDVSSLRHVVHAAAPCPIEVKRRMIEWWGPCIDEYYAATEGGGTIVFAEEWLKRPGTVGQPWPISEIGIFDDDGARLRAGEIGTVYMKMQTGDFTYHKDEAKTQDNRLPGGWFTVGDVGELDDEGWLFLRDRKIDMIISGGANIYPSEVEGELLSHPKVADVAVFGIPHPDWGEEVKAVVETTEGVEGGPGLEAEIIRWCHDRMAGFKTPRSIDFVEKLPRDPNGKLYKRRLRAPYWERAPGTI